MTETMIMQQQAQQNGHTEWLAMSAAILRTSNLVSLDELLDEALNLWLQQLSPAVRWQVAIDLYTTEEVSLGRAAEIAGLPTVVFMEKLRAEGIALIAAHSTVAQKERRKSLIHAGFNIPGR